MRKPIFILPAILVLAFVLRFWGVWNQDILGDEAADAFRSIGYLDYLGTSFQTQPIDWYKDTPLPFWTKLSFHDFPPLAILIQHIFFSIFGDSILVARLPAILFGTGSVFLIYLLIYGFRESIGFPESKNWFGLLAAFLFAINGAMVGIFRTSLLEPVLLFFILLNIYAFFQLILGFRESYGFPKSIIWWLFGGTLGLIALTKYTGVFIVPVYVFYLLISGFRESVGFPKSKGPISPISPISPIRPISPISPISPIGLIKNWRLYAALGLALLLFSPVIIYNFYLFKTTGHFDLQIAYLLGQNTPEWAGLLGKIQSPFSDIGKNLADLYGIPMLTAVFIGLAYWSYKSYKSNWSNKFYFFVLLYLLFATLLFVKIGSASRFLALYGPAFITLAALAVQFLWQYSGYPMFKKRTPDVPNIEISTFGHRESRYRIFGYFLKFIVIAFIIFEIGFSLNKNFIQTPDYGVTKLDQYFTQEFKNKESAVIPGTYNPHLTEVVRQFAQKKSDKPTDFFMIVYNDNIALPTIQWVFYRRLFYHSIPTFYVENFVKAVQKGGEDSFKGFDVYFVQSTEHTLLNPFKTEKTAGLEFENRLKDQGLEPVKIIYGQNNLPMFRVYKFSL